MHREERGAAAGEVAHRAAHGLRDVVELQVGKDLVSARGKPRDELEGAGAAEELEADLVEARGVAELLDQRARLLGRRHVQGNDEPLRGGDRGHFWQVRSEYWRND